MFFNNDPVTVPMIERNSSDPPEMDTSDLNSLVEEAVLSFHHISYQETVQSSFACCKHACIIERLSNIRLLDVLAARKDPRGLSGDILINGNPRPANFTCTSGYVPQKDMVMHTLTVRENVEFSAALRLPITVTRDEKRRRINEVLELLHLDKESNVKPRSKELRKRTSIAMELVTQHPILMSRMGRTIIFSIDRPQYSIFRLFDSLTLVASGKVMFHGPAQEALPYFISAGYDYDSHNDPADFFLDIISGHHFSALLDTEEDGHEYLSERQHQVTEELANMYAQSSLYSETGTELDPLLGEQNAGRNSALEEITWVTPFWHQLRWIICRSLKNFKDFPRTTIIKAFIIFILIVCTRIALHILKNDCFEVQSRAYLLFLFTVLQCVMSVTAGEVHMIDRDHFPHEYTSGYYRVSSYFLGKLLGDLVPRRLLPNSIFTVIVFIIAGVDTDVKGFFMMIFTIMMLTCSVSSLLLSLGAGQIAKGVPTTFLATIYFVPTLFTLGLSVFFINGIQGLSWIKYLSIPHYGFTAFLHNDLLGKNFCSDNKTAEFSRCQNSVICTGEEYLAIQDIDLSSWGFWENHVALVCITIILFSSNYVGLVAFMKIRHFLR
ncbi:hypothetical protein U0070_007880, partial [Myodes glareolus]